MKEISSLNVNTNEHLVLIGVQVLGYISEPEKQAGYLWRIGSGVYGLTTGAVGGAVGVGVGSVKWVAGKGYDAGHAVVSTGAAIVTKVKVKRKSKNE